MKKLIIFIFFILAAGQPTCAFQEVIVLETDTKPLISETMLDATEADDNPVSTVDDNTIYKENGKQESSGERKQNNIQLRSGIVNYNPQNANASPETFLLHLLKDTTKDIYELEVERTDVPAQLLKDKLTFNFEKGPLDSLHLWSAYQMNFSTEIQEKDDTDSKFNVGLINILFDGKFKGGKENFRIMLDPTHRSSHPEFMQTFFQDFYVESSRIPHHKILIGNSRPGVGIEGAQSPYTLSFINRSQISRNLSNMRKFGVRLRGDYSLADYDVGIYSSSTNFTSFFPGHELDAWVNLKPLGKTDGKYGKLITGAGIQSGEKHGTNYYMTGAYAGYRYKKFWTKFEYAHANGSNGGAGLTNARSQGFFVTAGYFLTKKLELLARYDHFDPDRNINKNNRKELTLGTNYYLKGQALKLIFNYVFCNNDDAVDSHRLMVGTQIIL